MNLYQVFYNTIVMFVNANNTTDVTNILLESFPNEFEMINNELYYGSKDIVEINDISDRRIEIEKYLLDFKNTPGYISGINYEEGIIERGILCYEAVG